MKLLPKSMQDIGPKERNRAFKELHPLVNLSSRAGTRFGAASILPVIRAGFFGLAIVWFFFGTVTAPTVSVPFAVAAEDEDERAALEAELKELEAQMDQYQEQIEGYKKQGGTLQSEISSLNSKVAKLNLQIQAVTLTIRELDRKISDTKFKIQSTESTLESHRESLAALLRNLHSSEQENLLSVFLKNPRLSDFFSDLNGMLALQNNVRVEIEKISDLHDQLKDEQGQLLLAKADAQTARAYQDAQRKQVDAIKSQKNQLLAVTKGQESKYQTLLKETKESAAKIRNRLFQLLGGGEMKFEEAYEYAKLASGATGVSPALILAVLDRESALGQNVGKCSYKTAMSPANRPVFEKIVAELGLNPDTLMVSCPNRDGVYGGAMGPAQFIPSTWNIYKDKVAQVTGHRPPSPWNNADAFVATALYLKDAGGASDSIAEQRRAAARYYAGGNWSRYLWTYGEAVVSKARKFADDIAAITG